ncbi:MAG: hypothetical protein HIU89_07830 [Proteobacteria bacterium]|nr:hypothetical protein [Pseudomonadota bacterium]
MRRLSTSCKAVSPRQLVHQADKVGVVRMAIRDPLELRLRAAVLSGHMATAWTGATGAGRRQGNEPSTTPLELVVQWAAKLGPALVEDRLVEPRFDPDIPARSFDRSRRAARHALHLQVLDAHHRVVLADGWRVLVQDVAPGIAEPLVEQCDFGLCLPSVLAELHLAAHRPSIALPPVGRVLRATGGVRRDIHLSAGLDEAARVTESPPSLPPRSLARLGRGHPLQ